jgi:hypothetical protein
MIETAGVDRYLVPVPNPVCGPDTIRPSVRRRFGDVKRRLIAGTPRIVEVAKAGLRAGEADES